MPEDVPLKDPEAFRLIGRSVPRLDVPAKVTGQAVFGIDAGPADARIAVVARCPVFGGTVRSHDPSASLAVDVYTTGGGGPPQSIAFTPQGWDPEAGQTYRVTVIGTSAGICTPNRAASYAVHRGVGISITRM